MTIHGVRKTLNANRPFLVAELQGRNPTILSESIYQLLLAATIRSTYNIDRSTGANRDLFQLGVDFEDGGNSRVALRRLKLNRHTITHFGGLTDCKYAILIPYGVSRGVFPSKSPFLTPSNRMYRIHGGERVD